MRSGAAFSERRFWCLCLCALGFSTTANAAIRYDVSDVLGSICFSVTMHIPDVKGEVILRMAWWNALYQIRDFSAHVQRVEAFAGEESAPIEKLDKQTWRVTGTGTIAIRYATYWDEGGPLATQLNGEHVFINPAMISMYVPERRSEAVELGMFDVPLEWQVASESLQMSEQMERARKFGLGLRVVGQLADAPIEAGRLRSLTCRG